MFAEVVATFAEPELDRIGDQGVRLFHVPSGLGLHFFRVGPSLAMVGSLAGAPEQAPSPDLLHRAALALAARLPYTEATCITDTGWCHHCRGLATRSGPVGEIAVEVRDETGSLAGTLTVRVYSRLIGISGEICIYHLSFHVARIRLEQIPADGPFRGPHDLFLAGTIELPCGRLTFLTEELAYLNPGEEQVFDEPGPLLGELDCAVPCLQTDIQVNLNAILRNANNDPFDPLKAFLLAMEKVDPRTKPQTALVGDLIRTHGHPTGSPQDPIQTAENVRGTTVGVGQTTVFVRTFQSGYTNIEFTATLVIAGSCDRSLPEPNRGEIRCRVPEGATGMLTLQAKALHPEGALVAVGIFADALPPGWPRFPGGWGLGTVTAEYVFTVPMGSAGRIFRLAFFARAAGAIVDSKIDVFLEVIPREEIKAPSS
ncbi:hypothetical protein H5T57_03160 [Candidatus Bipolaricaulota bacterium]|nr:hypothetical protein [Candidatus Bipolaricaulota bacterium]